MRNFFQSLEAFGTRYLLISGQASVLYGAALFSEDVDLWIEPTTGNLASFREALQVCHARVYKLTPPLELEFFERGHGFHFVLPETDGGEAFLDVMGVPPRVGSYDASARRAQTFVTAWGPVVTVGIADLVELKKTQRLEDYAVISRLALAFLGQRGADATQEERTWVLHHLFSLDSLRLFLEERPDHPVSNPDPAPPWLRAYAAELAAGAEPSEGTEWTVLQHLQERMAELQQADRRYWRPIISELRSLRAMRGLLPEGDPV